MSAADAARVEVCITSIPDKFASGARSRSTTSTGGAAPVGRDDEAAAIEEQIVVAADLIDVDHRHILLARDVAEHRLAHALLADGKWRRREVQQDLGAEQARIFGR